MVAGLQGVRVLGLMVSGLTALRARGRAGARARGRAGVRKSVRWLFVAFKFNEIELF